MQALIDNYVMYEQPKSLAVSDWKVLPVDSSLSVVISAPKQDGINQRIYRLLKEYAMLEFNWDEDSALAPDTEALKWALYLTSLLERAGQPIYHAAPGPNGEVMLDIRNDRNKRAIEIIFYPDRSTIIFFPANDRPEQKPFNSGRLPEYLEWLNGQKQEFRRK